MVNVDLSNCLMCPFEADTKSLVLSHLRLVHKNDPKFLAQCSVDGCTYTSRTFDALYSHIYRRHPECGIIQRKGPSSRLRIDLGANIQTPVVTHVPNEEQVNLQLDPVVTGECYKISSIVAVVGAPPPESPHMYLKSVRD